MTSALEARPKLRDDIKIVRRETHGRPHSLGIGHPGAISSRTGLLKNSNTVVMNGKPLARDLRSLLRRRFAMENDANCFALAEARQGAGRGKTLVFGVIMGTGTGGGIVYNGTGTAVNPERPHHYELILDTSEMAGTISVELAAANPGGTDVEVALELRSKGFLSSMFFPVVSRAIGNGLPDQIEELAVRLGT